MSSDAKPLSAAEIALVAEEVRNLAGSARIQHVHARVPAGVTLELRAPGQTHQLVIVADAPLTRLYLCDARPARPETALEFVRQLRHRLEGARITGVDAAPGDRIVRIATDRGTLIAELTGRHGNLAFVDADGTLRAVARPMRSERRSLIPGSAYVAPTPRPAKDAPGERIDAPRFGLAALPPDGSRGRAVAEHFDPLEASTRLDELRAVLSRKLRRAEKGIGRRATQLEADREAAAGADRDRRNAEALVALGRPRARGLAKVEAVDYGDPETRTIEIALDPALTLQENADRLFKRHRKLVRSRDTVEARLRAARAALEALAAARQRLASFASEAEVESLAAKLVEAGHLSERALRTPAKRAGAGRTARAPERALPYRSYRSQTGREILVGRSSAANDELSLRVARGSDAWFHAEGSSGSHVVLRLGRGEDPDPDSVIDAATLAAHFSRGPKSGKVGVIWTRAARVRKPKGSKPGLVTATGTRSLTLRIEPKRLARLLGREGPPDAASPDEAEPR